MDSVSSSHRRCFVHEKFFLFEWKQIFFWLLPLLQMPFSGDGNKYI